MSMTLMAKAMSIKVGNPLRKLVLIKLADNANDQGECWPSVAYIAEQCEISERSVQNHIQQLVKDGLVRIEIRKASSGLNQSNLYHLSLKSEGAAFAPYGAGDAPTGAGDSPLGGAGAAPRTSHSFEPVKEPLKPLAKKGAGVRRNSLPENFAPTENHHALAKNLSVSLESEFLSFCDHHRAKGSTFVDWNAALNTWIRNAAKFAGNKSGFVKNSRSMKPATSEIPEGFNQNLPAPTQGGSDDDLI